MKLHAVLLNRFLKIIGHTVKSLSYVFHFVFPNHRFTIPEQSKPLWKPRKSTKIPRIIWQTNYTNRVTLPVYVNYLCNRLLAADWEYRYVSTEKRYEYINRTMPEHVSKAFAKLTNGASQADLWRVITMFNEGGIYMDIDAHLVWPPSWMIKSEYNEIVLRNKKHFTNYFIASVPGNIIFKETVDVIVENIEQKRIEQGVYHLTGPMALNKALEGKVFNHRFYRHTCVQGDFTNEYFQYMDRPGSKWNKAEKSTLLKNDEEVALAA